jgi:hypothetical protein
LEEKKPAVEWKKKKLVVVVAVIITGEKRLQGC